MPRATLAQLLTLSAFSASFTALPFALGEAIAARAPVVHEVKMLAEGSGYRFVPADIAVKRGDQVRFVMTSGGPHNVAFDADRIADALEGALAAGMPDRIQPLAGALLMKDGESYTLSTAGVAPGVYPYFCMPHAAMGMKGTITVE
jgi:plastocyanin